MCGKQSVKNVVDEEREDWELGRVFYTRRQVAAFHPSRDHEQAAMPQLILYDIYITLIFHRQQYHHLILLNLPANSAVNRTGTSDCTSTTSALI